jgi:hypothetical protein
LKNKHKEEKMDFELSEEMRMLSDMAYKFAQAEIAPSLKRV